MSHILDERILLSKCCWLIKSHQRYHRSSCFNMVVINNVHQHLLIALNTGPDKVLLKCHLVLECGYILFTERRKVELAHRLRKSWLLRESVAFELLPPSLAHLPISRRSLRCSSIGAFFRSPFLAIFPSLFIRQLLRRFGLL